MMPESTARSEAGIRLEPAGVLLIGKTQPDVAAVFRIVRHAGATATSSSNRQLRFAFGSAASSQWLGWYSSRILANGWQPYDQPHPAAYIPLGYDHLAKQQLPAHGVLLRQSALDPAKMLTTHDGSLLFSCSEAELPGKLAVLLEHVGVPAQDVDLAVRFFLEAGALS
jgi:hypothetical protein